jgi:hypothetical protein
MNTKVRFSATGDIKSPQKRPIPVKWYHAIKVAKEVQTLRERARYYVTPTLPILLNNPTANKLGREGREIKHNLQ